ncbi:type IV secretory system conjugative DNA transfer family protein [Streptomyces sp. NPDC059708]|uniref:type IV secretory system conjugative DNA transfer family protein n=1 Tax=Streptomyces sp. NPDC059708 TaxID=3346916 RepID=UPI00369A1A2F
MAVVDSSFPEGLAPEEIGYYLGQPVRPQVDVPLYSAYDRSLRVIGPMGSGKTFRFLARAIRGAPGPGLFTSTKPDVYELTAMARARRGPVVTFDPQGVVPGQEPLRLSPIHGAHDTQVAELRAKAFVAGSRSGGSADEGAEFYRGQAATLLRCLLQAAALDGASLRDVLRWARRLDDPAPRSILDHHPGAGPGWAEDLMTVISGDDRTVGNTRATLAAALAPFAHQEVIDATDVSPEKATDLEGLLEANGSVYLLGKDSPTTSVSPLVTAIAEDILDRAEKLAYLRPARRLDPPMLVALDEAANIAPLPSLRQRVADGRGRGLCVMYFVQGWSSAVARFGRHNAAELADFTNNVMVFGGVKDPDFLRDMEALCGKRRVLKTSSTSSRGRSEQGTRSVSEDLEPVMQSWEIGQLDRDRGHALLLAGDLPPVITSLPLLSEDPDWPQISEEVAQIRAHANTAASRLATARRREHEEHHAAWEARNGGPVGLSKGSDRR